MKTLKVTSNKSFKWSFGIHAGILALGFLPLATRMPAPEAIEYEMEIDFMEFPEIKEAGSEGLQARSEVYHPEPEPTTDFPEKDPIPIEDNEPVDEVTIAEEVSEIESEVVSEVESEVVASSNSDHGKDEETHGDGGGSGSPIEGNQDGGAMAGDGGAGDGLEGDGIITRRIIYREDIATMAKQNGKIVLNICINREGKVETVSYNSEKTTITDKDLIRQASEIASRYRFETKYSAPKRECGQLTFIFRIEEPVTPVWKFI